jgi:hypothetical protein
VKFFPLFRNKLRPHLQVCRWFGSTKPLAHPLDGDGASSRNVGKPSHYDAAGCPRKFHRIISPRNLQDLNLNFLKIPGTYKLSEDFAKLDDRCIFCNEIVHTTFGSTSQKDHNVQNAVGTRVEQPQIPEHTNYARSVRQPFPFNTGLRFYREMAVATTGPFQILHSLCVIDTNFTIL